MPKDMYVMRKMIGYDDAGSIYKLKFMKIVPLDEYGFPAYILWKLDNGNSWNFRTVTQFLNQSLLEALEKDNLEIYDMKGEK